MKEIKECYCLICKKNVIPLIMMKNKKFKNDEMDIEYEGKIAKCPICEEEVYDDDVIKYDREKILETYKIEYEIISEEEIIEIMKKYNIGKRPLSLLLGFGEITITRYLTGYVPTPKNSKILKKILYSPSEYYSILQMNKDKINETAFLKSEKATKKLLDINASDQLIDEVSKYIINHLEISNLSLQKLLYYIQMFYMSIYEKPAFTNKCSAWEYGPVFGSIYYKYKSFGRNIISEDTSEYVFEEDLKETIDTVLKYFGCFSGPVLMYFTHQEEPWKKAFQTESKIIEKNDIKIYGDKIIKEYNINNISEINNYSNKLFENYLKK